MKKNNEEITFKDILSIFIPKLWLILIIAVVCGAVLGVYADGKDDTYTATSTIDVRKNSDTINNADFELANTVIMKIREMVYSDDFLIEVIANIYGRDDYPGLTPGYIRSVFSYAPIDNGMFRISVKTTNAELSQRIAQSFETLLEIEFLSYSNNALIAIPFDSAKIPTSPDDKGVLKNAVIGFVGGGVVATVAVWMLYILDTTVRSKKKLEDNFAYPILGYIPREKKEKAGKEI